MTEDEIRALIAEAAQEGARRALASVGLHDADSAQDIHDLRDLLAAWRGAKTAAWHTVVKMVTASVLAALALAVGLNLHWGQ